MILSDREIQMLVALGLVGIDPLPPPNSPLWSSTALDLTLDSVVLVWTLPTSGAVRPIAPGAPDFDVQALMNDPNLATRIALDPVAGYILPSGGFVLGYTEQKVRLPHVSRLAARVEGKSSLARLGVGVHVTAPTIHAGFGSHRPEGVPIQLEIFNLGPWEVRLTPGMRVCQLIFEEVREVPAAGYSGQFAGQQAFTAPA